MLSFPRFPEMSPHLDLDAFRREPGDAARTLLLGMADESDGGTAVSSLLYGQFIWTVQRWMKRVVYEFDALCTELR